MNQELLTKINLWKNEPSLDEDLKNELNSLSEEELYDAFYKDIEFGTGGLRGVLGVGSNRMNKYIVAKATKGFVEYLLSRYPDCKEKGVVISYDCRHKSQEFAKIASSIIAATGTKVYMFSNLRPTPELSYAVRHLECVGGIMITASHNPPQYNGYKVYDHTGCQLVPHQADQVIARIRKITDLFNVPTMDFEEGVKQGLIHVIDEEIDRHFVDACRTVKVQDLPAEVKKNIKIVVTPLHGTAQVSLPTLLKEEGYDVHVVEEQMVADPNFSTCKSPNPENKEAFELAEKLGREIHADLLIATDPNADRMGIGVLNSDGSYTYLTGNQSGCLLLDYLATFKKISKKGVVLNTIVTSNSGKAVYDMHGLRLIQTLTGFKFIGEQMGILEHSETEEFFFGYEESYGYVIKDFVRDKDSIQSSLLLCEVASYYKSQNMTLVDALAALYEKIGYFQEDLINIYMEGESGAKKIEQIVRHFQNNHLTEVAGKKVQSVEDYDKLVKYENGEETPLLLPKSLVIKYIFDDGGWFVLRPSGTEPKLKIYISVKGETKQAAINFVEQLKKAVADITENI